MKLAFIQTGGTIDKDYPHQMKGYAFEMGDPAFKRIMEQAKHQHDVSYHEVFRKDSLDITEADRQRIKNYIAHLSENTIIITHGSDTLLETAKVLSEISAKTIILTASMLPEKFKNSDSHFNLGMAVGGAQILNSGVYIAIQGYLAKWDEFDRDMVSGQYFLR